MKTLSYTFFDGWYNKSWLGSLELHLIHVVRVQYLMCIYQQMSSAYHEVIRLTDWHASECGYL